MRTLATLGLGAALMLAATGAFAQAPSPSTAKPAAPAATVPAAKPAPATAAKPAALIDINTATPAELETLPGIGKARSEAIVKGRPYNGKDDIANRGIVPQAVYADVKDRIIAKQPTKH